MSLRHKLLTLDGCALQKTAQNLVVLTPRSAYALSSAGIKIERYIPNIKKKKNIESYEMNFLLETATFA